MPKMVKEETVKIEVELPENLVKAVTKVCDKFSDNPNDFIFRAIKGDLEAAVADEFGTYIEVKEVPIMVDVETAVYLRWWYKVAQARLPQGPISEFLKSATRNHMKKCNYLNEITEEEARELARMKEEAGIPTLGAFTLEIEDLIKA